MKKIILPLLFIMLFAFNAYSQKYKNLDVELEYDKKLKIYFAEIAVIGPTIFAVKMKKGQSFIANAVIKSNNANLSGLFYAIDENGEIDENTISVGEGSHSNSFKGYSTQDETVYFKISANPKGKYLFAITIEKPRR